MANFISQLPRIIQLNTEAIASVLEDYNTTANFIAENFKETSADFSKIYTHTFRNTTDLDLQAGEYTSNSTEISHFTSILEGFTVDLSLKGVRHTVSEQHRNTFNEQGVVAKALKGLTRQWDTDFTMSTFNANNLKNVQFLPQVTGAITLDKILRQVKEIKQEVANQLATSQSNIKIVINQVVDRFLSETVTNGTRTNREMFEAEVGALGVGYKVLDKFKNDAYIAKSGLPDYPANGILLIDQGLILGSYARNNIGHHGLIPQLFKVITDEKEYTALYDFFMHTAVVQVVDKSISAVVLTGV